MEYREWQILGKKFKIKKMAIGEKITDRPLTRPSECLLALGERVSIFCTAVVSVILDRSDEGP